MFKELAPLLRHRAVLLTVSHINEDQFRVNVVPKKISDGENDALTIPVSVSGTVDDLDAQLPQTLVAFVSGHLELKNTLDRAKADMDAAAKVAQTEVRNKSKIQVEKKDKNATTTARPPSVESPVEQKPEPAKTTSLFEASLVPEPVMVAANTPPVDKQATGCQLSDEDQEIWAEINAEREYEE